MHRAIQDGLCPDVMESFSWHSVVATQGPCVDSLGIVLFELEDDSCAHSWKAFSIKEHQSAETAIQRLLDWETTLRPTTFFSYFGVHRDGRQELIGVGTVCERIRKEFPYDGFPVIARCFIRKQFRGRGLYSALLYHRYHYCVARWGEELNAVHLGSAHEAVRKLVMSDNAVHAPFRYVENERLDLGESYAEVHDYLSFTEPYARQLRDSVSAARVPADLIELLPGSALRCEIESHMDAMLAGKGMHSISGLAQLLSQARRLGWEPEVGSPALARLLAFGRALKS